MGKRRKTGNAYTFLYGKKPPTVGQKIYNHTTMRSSSLNFRKTSIHNPASWGRFLDEQEKGYLARNETQMVVKLYYLYWILDAKESTYWKPCGIGILNKKITYSYKQVFKCTLSDRTNRYLMVQMRAISVVDEKKNKFAGKVNLS